MPFYRLSQVVLFIFFKLFFGLKVYGGANVPRDVKGVILAPNHVSYFDPPLLGAVVRRHITFLAKEYLFRVIVIGLFLRWYGVLPIRTEKDDFRSMRQLIRLLKEGRCIVVFPEGTRSPDGEPQKAEGGVGFLAMKSGAQVVPIWIQGTYEAFPRDRRWFRCHPIRVTIGQAFTPAEMAEFKGHEEPYLAVGQRVMADIARMRKEAQKV